MDTKTGKQVSRKVKPSWQLQGLTYANAIEMPVEFHSISRAKTPAICTPLESEEMVISPNPQQAENLVSADAPLDRPDRVVHGPLRPRRGVACAGRLADWSQSLLPCNMCALAADCPAWAGET